MSSPDCIFCKIIANELPANSVAENESVIVIKDIAPKAPIHYLIIPKKHVQDVQSLEKSDAHIAADLFFMAQQLGKEVDAYRLIVNNGAQAGQSVSHLHLHFLAGKKMTDF